MKVYDFNHEYQVYFSAQDRFVKRVGEQVFEAYHVTVVDEEKQLKINTVDFTELTVEEINKFLGICGLEYNDKQNLIVQKHNKDEIIASEAEKIPYVLADRVSVGGYISGTVTYDFHIAKELNEILLEQDVPIRFTPGELSSL